MLSVWNAVLGNKTRRGSGTDFTGGMSSGGSPMCVSVWWGASPDFEEGLLSELLALSPKSPLTQQEVLNRLATMLEPLPHLIHTAPLFL